MRVGPQRRSVLRAFRRRPLLLPKTQPPAFAHLLDLNAPRLALRFDLTTLDLVLASAETLGITRGAEREHLALAAASKRLSDLEYLQRVTEIKDAVVSRKGDDLPPVLNDDADAAAVYGLLRPFVANHLSDVEQAQTTAAEAAMAVWDIFRRNRKVGYWDDLDAQRRTMNEIDDYLYDEVKGARGIALSTDEMDEIIEKTMQLARHRMAG